MAISGIGQNQLYLQQQQAAALAVNSGAVQAPFSRPVNSGTSSTGIDFVKFGELVRSHALKGAGVNPATNAPVTEVPEIKEPELLKVSVAQVKNIFGAQPEYSKANEYKNFTASNIYASIANDKADYSKYDALANVKLGA